MSGLIYTANGQNGYSVKKIAIRWGIDAQAIVNCNPGIAGLKTTSRLQHGTELDMPDVGATADEILDDVDHVDDDAVPVTAAKKRQDRLLGNHGGIEDGDAYYQGYEAAKYNNHGR
jgi:phage tail protein X